MWVKVRILRMMQAISVLSTALAVACASTPYPGTTSNYSDISASTNSAAMDATQESRDEDCLSGQYSKAYYPAFPGANYTGLYSAARQVSASQLEIAGVSRAHENAEPNANYVPGDSDSGYVIVTESDAPLAVAWAMYTVADLHVERPASIDFEITAAPAAPGSTENLPLNCYVLIADFSANRWRLYGPFRDELSLQQFCANVLVLNSSAQRERFIDQSGRFYFAVLTACDPSLTTEPGQVVRTAARIDRITVNTTNVDAGDYVNTWPHFISVSAVEPELYKAAAQAKRVTALDPSQFVSFGWTHIDDESDASQNAAQSYAVRCGMLWQGRIYGKFSGDNSTLEAGSIMLDSPSAHSGWNSFTDSGLISKIVPGRTYYYYVCGQDSSGDTGQECWWSAYKHTVRILPPETVTASLNQDLSAAGHANAIRIIWDEPLGTGSYELYRNTINSSASAVLIATPDAGVTEYYDEDAELLQYYYYWIKAVGVGDGDPQTPREDGEVSDLSQSSRGIRHAILTLHSAETPLPAGSGSMLDPWLLSYSAAAEYQFSVTDQDGADHTAAINVSWGVQPPIAAQFAAVPKGKLTNIFEFAGDFTINARISYDVFEWQADAYCRVANDQP